MRRVAASLAYWGCRGASFLHLAGLGVERIVGGISGALLVPEDMRRVTARLYDNVRLSDLRGLFDWEATWFSRDLPAPPARVLVGGCGRGREVRELLAQGYEVWAFDPAMDSAERCRRENPGAVVVARFGYEDLVLSLTVEAAAIPSLLPRDVRFDAILLGWGSLTHVIDGEDQLAVLQLLDRLAPVGPILASFNFGSRAEGKYGSRAARLGRALGRKLGGQAEPSASSDNVVLLANVGFSYWFDEARLQALAAACHRRLALYPSDGFPHATFWPTS